jgi:hypothetical protein
MKHNNNETNLAFARGFVKAATAKNLSLIDFDLLVKQAIHRNDTLTYQDIANIRKELSHQGKDTPYTDREGEDMQRYKADLLAKRDEALNSNISPEVAGGLEGLRAGAIGAGVTGLSGLLLGHLLHGTHTFNLPPSFTSKLPTILGTGGATVGGILNAMPAAKRTYEARKALNKLEDPNNIKVVQRLQDRENSLLNQAKDSLYEQ